MEYHILKVELISWFEMHVKISSAIEKNDFDFKLIKDTGNDVNIHLKEINKTSEGYLLKYSINEFFELGHDYLLISASNSFIAAHLDVSKAVDFDNFDNVFTYLGNDLGATYHKNYTDFALWAPLANDVYLKYIENEKSILIRMDRTENGVYRTKLIGDYDGTLYSYIIYLNGTNFETIDPYAKSANLNAKMGAVINFDKISVDTFIDSLPPFKNYIDAIIYELHIRDFTIHNNSNIVNKGKFLGLVEPNKVTKNSHPAGLDYISNLNVTHVQLQPIQKIATIDETRPNETYNWGYDPYHYFVLEGSYSTSPNDPYARIIEFKKLVREFHKRGIRVNVDVVYNHMYEGQTSILNRITPNYFFRHDSNYKFLNHSGCGNDVASEKVMARKLIVDSLVYLTKTFDIDGFRFDLMGLIDVKTMNEVSKNLKAIKKDIMLYGEGWNMMDKCSDGSLLANMDNANLLPDFAFFNDKYRNFVRGSGGTAKLDDIGYLLGNNSHLDDFKFSLLGSCLPTHKEPLFADINQSLNYIECHDNATIYDIIDYSLETSEKETLQIIKLINKSLLLSCGIVFIHAGQEIGLSKYGEHNTYNMGDKYNCFNYDILDARYELALSFINYIKQRRSIPYYKITSTDELKNSVSFKEVDGSIFMKFSNKDFSNDSYVIAYNPTKETIYYDFDHDMEQFVKGDKNNEKIYTKHAMIFPLSSKIFKY